ncbi:MAG: M36 family metallopeptidase [Myxococcota bacterium]
MRLSIALVFCLLASPTLAQLSPAPANRWREVRTHNAQGELRFVRYPQRPRVAGSPTEAARTVLARLGQTDLVVERTFTTHGFTVVRFRRQVWGLPVLNAAAAVRFDPQGRLELVALDVGSPTGASPGAAVEAPRAEAVRATRWVRARPVQEHLAFLDDGFALRRVWVIEVQGALHERANVLFDAGSGDLVAVVPLILHQRGRVYDPNPPLASEMTTDVDLDNLTSLRFLTGRYARAQSCRPSGVSECVPEQRAASDDDGNWFFEPADPAFDDEFAEVNTYFHTNRVAEYFRDTHGLEWSCCGESNIIDIVANYVETPGVQFSNAFYSPSSCSRSQCALMAFGQGRQDFGYDGDVVYHEYGHAIVDVTARLSSFNVDPRLGVGYENGGLNEGFADYFSATITGDPNLADYFAGAGELAGEGGLRELDNTLRCADDLFGESHADGRIWAGALWDIREGIGTEKADALAFLTLSMLSDGSDFRDAGEALRMSAMSLDTLTAEDVAAVDAVIETRGLLTCERVVPMVPDRVYRGFSGQDFLTGNLGGGVVPLHYSIEVPPNAQSITFRLDSATGAGQYDVFVRNNSRVRYVGSRRPPLQADATFEGARVIRISRGTEHPLPRCGTIFLAIIATDILTRGPSIYELSATVETSDDVDNTCPDPDMDAGVDAGSDAAVDASVDAGVDAEPPTIGGVTGGGCNVAGDSPLTFGAIGTMLMLWRRRRS